MGLLRRLLRLNTDTLDDFNEDDLIEGDFGFDGHFIDEVDEDAWNLGEEVYDEDD